MRAVKWHGHLSEKYATTLSQQVSYESSHAQAVLEYTGVNPELSPQDWLLKTDHNP
ncbi:hypothetical protein QNI22_33455 [Cytophagaceae bacterium BD1B2-1]|uniref:Uncharacterized protein n=1 Tax=Xanthocytophaga agilis TaxID=3048010 RepID=A0AAE3R8H4_9BACT|nr:hypothetical protein [Xanthocytophaga agilis]